MTILERVHSIVNSNIDVNDTSVEKLIYMAYYIGREEAVKEVSDMYVRHITEQHERAGKCRYRHMAESIVAPERYLYHPDYRQDMTATFGSDPADV